MPINRVFMWLLAGVACGYAAMATAAPKRFQERALLSPDKNFAANIEWENLGFVGIIRMKIYDGQGRLQRVAEVPEIDPEPANLVWINEEWVASESFLGERAGGFFYVHAPTAKGYLIEIVEPRPNSDWIFTVASNDPVSSQPLANVSKGKTSLFPILVRNVPDSEMGFFQPEFVKEFTTAVDLFNAFRKENGFSQLEIRGKSDIRDGMGGIVVAEIDDRAEVIYFPAGAKSPQDMLTRVRRQVLPENVQELLKAPDAPELRPRWLEDGEYIIEAARVPLGAIGNESETSASVILRSKFEGVSDKPYSGDDDEDTADAAETSDTKSGEKGAKDSKGGEKPKSEVKVSPSAKKATGASEKKPATADKAGAAKKPEASDKKAPTKAKTRLDVKKPHER